MGRIWQIYSRTGVGSVHAWITAATRHKATGGIIAVLSALGFIACVLILWRAT